MITTETTQTLRQQIIANANQFAEQRVVSDVDGCFTWHELLTRAASILAEMQRHAAFDDARIVPILVDRSKESVAAIVACVLGGKAFAPVWSQQPETRLTSILRKSGCEFYLNVAENVPVSTFTAIDVRSIPTDVAAIQAIDDIQTDERTNVSDQLLYVLFTSGSTGEPKGVMVSDRNIENTIRWSQHVLDWSPADVIGVVANFYFDISMFDLFTSLLENIPLAILSDPSDPNTTMSEIETHGITSLFAAPVFFTQFVQRELLSNVAHTQLRQILSGGDFFPPQHMLAWLDNASDVDVWNVWGPTETSIVNTMHRVTGADRDLLNAGKCVSVGRHHALMPFCLLDPDENDLKIADDGRGEICMIGPSVTLGYLDDPATTSSVYKSLDGQPAFRTRDLGYVDELGDLFISGRLGSMVKIGGYRVELGEIEAAASQVPNVHLSVAFIHDVDDNREIWLAVEPKRDVENFSIMATKRSLRTLLPQYMVPKRVLVFDQLPTNQNGKLDRTHVARLATSADS